MKHGWFITLEGGEGAGKSTQIRLLAEHLRAQGREVVVTREPGGSALGEAIRGLLFAHSMQPRTELALVAAGRQDHLDQIILPALERGAVVLCDRYVDSTYAYQGWGRRLDLREVAAVASWSTARRPPDLTLWFDLPVTLGLARAGKRSDNNRFDAESTRFHRRIRAAFLERMWGEPQRIRRIDASQSIEAIQTQARGLIAALTTTPGRGG